MSGADLVYKIVTREQWAGVEDAGAFEGAPVDLADGYIHFSTAEQVAETVERHFAGQRDLLLIAVDASALGDALRYEPSRGGQLFPHLHADLPLSAVRTTWRLPLGPDGRHQFPPEVIPAGRLGGPITR